MKKTYETFEEMAADMTNGDFLAHQLSDHSIEICSIWQQSIKEFAKALDGAGIKPPDDPKIYERFWHNISAVLKAWNAGTNRRKPYSKELGKMTIEEARQRYDFKGKVGMRLVIPSFDGMGISEDYYVITAKQKS